MSEFHRLVDDCLANLLSPDHETRSAAEMQFNLLEVIDDLVYYLIDVMVNDETKPIELKQLCSCLLKKFVEKNWDTNQWSDQLKSNVKRLLLDGMVSRDTILRNNRKLRNSLTALITRISEYEWPEKWPELLDTILMGLDNGYGTFIDILVDLSESVNESQIEVIGAVILQRVYNILDQQQYCLETRAKCIKVNNNLIDTILLMSEYNDDVINRYLNPYLIKFLKLFNEKYIDHVARSNEMKLKLIELNCILIKKYKKLVRMGIINVQQFELIVSWIWFEFQSFGQGHGATVAQDQSSEDQEVTELHIILTIYDFMESLVKIKNLRKKINEFELINYMIKLMEVSDGSEDDIMVLVNDDNDYDENILRSSSIDLLNNIMETTANEEQLYTLIVKAVYGQLNEFQTNWKRIESCLFLIDYYKTKLYGMINKMDELRSILSRCFDFLTNNSNQHVLLSGRIVLVTAKYWQAFDESQVEQLIQIITAKLMDENESVIVKVAVIKAINDLVSSQIKLADDDLILKQLINLIVKYVNEEQLIISTLDTIRSLLSFNSSLMSNEQKICTLIISLLVKYALNPTICEQLTDLVKICVHYLPTNSQFETRLMQFLIQLMDQQPAITMSIVTATVKQCQQLSDVMVGVMVPLVCKLMLSTRDDYNVLQQGSILMKSYLCHKNQLPSANDEEMIYSIIIHLLDNKLDSDLCSVESGKLITCFLLKYRINQSDERLDIILKSILTKLLNSESIKLQQQLILIYSLFINYNLIDSLFQFLSSLPGPSSQYKSAFDFYIITWLTRQHLFYGLYEIKVTCYSLTKLLTYSLNQQNQFNLNQIMVNGDEIVNHSSGNMKTRSTGSKIEFHQIPSSIKILKLLLNELQSLIEIEETRNVDASDTEDESDGEGDDNNLVNALTNCLVDDEDEDEEEDDDDDINQLDPIYSLNLLDYLNTFLKEFKTNQFYDEFYANLNESECELLSGL